MDVADAKKLKSLEAENNKLKKLLAESDLEIEVMKEIAAKNGARPSGAQAGANTTLTENRDPAGLRSSPIVSGQGQSLGNQTGPADVVEAALADALRRAAEASEWGVVAQLAREA